MRVFLFVFLVNWLCIVPNSFAVTYHCETTEKYDFGKTYSQEELNKGKFSVRLEEGQEGAYVYRCSFTPSQQSITCDKYRVDKIEYDNNVNLKKYYVFNSQYNFQIFSNLSSLEDNGRGAIQYGKCQIQ